MEDNISFVNRRWSQKAIDAAVESVKSNDPKCVDSSFVSTISVLKSIEPFIQNDHITIPSYFSANIQQPTHSATLEASLEALKLEVRHAVVADHSKIVRDEIRRLTAALEQIAKGYTFGSKEDMQRFAAEACGQT
jgi:hypothetical protein